MGPGPRPIRRRRERMWRAGPLQWDVQAKNNTAGTGPGPGHEFQNGRERLKDALHVFTVTALNPKGIVFFVAFVPQFIVPTAPVLPQMVLLGPNCTDFKESRLIL